MQWTVAKIAEAVHGRLTRGGSERPIANISTDTRQLQPADCFVALAGEHFDGHDFVLDAVARQVAAVIVSRPAAGLGIPSFADTAVIEVPDTLYALGELARCCRQRHRIPVVGITGSNGKTSTKEMITTVLSQKWQVLKNKGNFNNLIGVPLTLLSLQPHHDVAVVEMGINVPGEMERLVAISCPTVGLITNIHPAHLEGLQSLDQIMAEKGRIWTGLGAEDLAVVNLDDDRLSSFSKGIKARTLTYSLENPAAQVKLDGPVKTQGAASLFDLILGKTTIPVRIEVLGMHQVQNAVASAAIAWGMGEQPETIALGLSKHKPVDQRMQTHRLGERGMLIDDTYNANPRSMLAAVQAALSASCENPLIAVLGEMRELGPKSATLHRELGRQVGRLGISKLITLGKLANEIVMGAQEAGMAASCCHHATSHEEIVECLSKERPQNAWILVKGSRGMRMEKVVDGILGK